MKKSLMVLIVVAAAFVSGCSNVVDTRADRARRIDQIQELQARMMVEDWDYLWLYERSTRLSPWHARIGR